MRAGTGPCLLSSGSQSILWSKRRLLSSHWSNLVCHSGSFSDRFPQPQNNAGCLWLLYFTVSIPCVGSTTTSSWVCLPGMGIQMVLGTVFKPTDTRTSQSFIIAQSVPSKRNSLGSLSYTEKISTQIIHSLIYYWSMNWLPPQLFNFNTFSNYSQSEEESTSWLWTLLLMWHYVEYFDSWKIPRFLYFRDHLTRHQLAFSYCVVFIKAFEKGCSLELRKVWLFLKPVILRNKTLFFFLIIIYLFIYLAVLDRFCARASSSCGKRGPLFIAVRGPLTIVASLVAEHRLQTHRLSSCGSRA